MTYFLKSIDLFEDRFTVGEISAGASHSNIPTCCTCSNKCCGEIVETKETTPGIAFFNKWSGPDNQAYIIFKKLNGLRKPIRWRDAIGVGRKNEFAVCASNALS